jgi:hypothetical protein
MIALRVIGIGLLFYLIGRIGGRSEDPEHFGSWRNAPTWARILFGARAGSISPYKISVELVGLAWVACGGVWAVAGDQPQAPLGQIIGLMSLGPVVAAVAWWIIAGIGETLRRRRR